MSLPDTIYWELGRHYNVRIEERGNSVRYEAFPHDHPIPVVADVRPGSTHVHVAHRRDNVGARDICLCGAWQAWEDKPSATAWVPDRRCRTH